MENSMTNGFCELNEQEMMMVDGGDLKDFVDKINPMQVVDFIYQAGQDFGAASVKFGRECYDLFCDVKKIFS